MLIFHDLLKVQKRCVITLPYLITIYVQGSFKVGKERDRRFNRGSQANYLPGVSNWSIFPFKTALVLNFDQVYLFSFDGWLWHGKHYRTLNNCQPESPCSGSYSSNQLGNWTKSINKIIYFNHKEKNNCITDPISVFNVFSRIKKAQNGSQRTSWSSVSS